MNATVDENWNSAYPYVVGPTFYGVVDVSIVDSVDETTTVYDGTQAIAEASLEDLSIEVFPNPASEFVAVQANGVLRSPILLVLYDIEGREVQRATINSGTTLTHLDTRLLYSGQYILTIQRGNELIHKNITIARG